MLTTLHVTDGEPVSQPGVTAAKVGPKVVRFVESVMPALMPKEQAVERSTARMSAPFTQKRSGGHPSWTVLCVGSVTLG